MQILVTAFLLIVCYGSSDDVDSKKPKGRFDNPGDINSYEVNIEPEGRMSRRVEGFLDPLFDDVAYWIHFMNFSTDANDTKKECSSKRFDMLDKISVLKMYLGGRELCSIHLRDENANLYLDCMNDISEFNYPPRVKIAFSLFCDGNHRWRIGPFNKWARGYENDEPKLMELATSVEFPGGSRMPLILSCIMEEVYLVQRCDRRNLLNFISIISSYLKHMKQAEEFCRGNDAWMRDLSGDISGLTQHMEQYYEHALKSSFTFCDSVNINETIMEHGPVRSEDFPILAKKVLKTLEYYGDNEAPKHLILTRYLTPEKDYYLHCPHGNCLSFRYKHLDLSIFYIRDPASVERRKAKRFNSTYISENRQRIHEVFRENQNVENLLEITGALIRANVSLTTNSAATLFLRRSATFGDCHLQFHYANTQPGNYKVSVINEYFPNPWPQWPPWNVKACENLVAYVFP